MSRSVPKDSPLCRGCVHFLNSYFTFGSCLRKVRADGIEPVHGVEQKRGYLYAHEERRRSLFGRKCGPEGKHYSPRDLGPAR